MIITPKTKLYLTLTVVALILAGTVLSIMVYWLPKMTSTHTAIHQSEAAIAAIERQQKNLSALSQQLKDRQMEDEHLKKEMWGFLQEDRFFDLWENFGATNKTTITLDELADAAPAPDPLQREASITITGSLSNVLRTLAAMSTLSPAVVINKIQLASGSEPNNVIAQVTCLTLWYDDSTQE